MNLLFLDTETTGKDETARMVQLAYKLAGSGQCNTHYFKPPIPISFEAMATHHITQEFIETFPSLAETPLLQDAMQSLIHENILVAHNAIFDIEILKREGFKVNNWICTLKVAQNLFDLPMYKLQYLRYWAHLNIEARAHDAEGDVLVLEALFSYLFKLMREYIPTDQEVLDRMMQITKDPVLLKRIAFGKHAGKEFAVLPKDYLQWLRRQDKLEPDLIYTLDYYLK